MSTDTAFMTKTIPAKKEGGPPIPNTDEERYLYALLDTQEGLNAALDALTARMAYANASETDDKGRVGHALATQRRAILAACHARQHAPGRPIRAVTT